MRYFDRHFDFCYYQLPDMYLDYFRTDKNAEEYNNEFYLKIYSLRKDDIKKYDEPEHIFGLFQSGARLVAYNILPCEIQKQIADSRLFLLGVVSPSVYTMMYNYFHFYDGKEKQIRDKFKERYKEDIAIVPIHLKTVFKEDWFDGYIDNPEFCNGDLKFVYHPGTDSYTFSIVMKNAKVTINGGEFGDGRIKQYEIFYNNPGVELNLLTYFSDISITADDMECEVFEEEF